ncbi:hypothetical protein BRD00_05170 [Halobacteriales archaeon QS_8_69_26]|nr:MAG: hypothetical protein BRD00_05170 [Halobacteriales archaeon QS_8_69_26]
MALAGPRLDRPSAIGEEGRPRTVSLWIATVVVLAAVTAGGAVIGVPELALAVGTPVGLTVAGIGLVNRERFGPQLAGYVLLLLFGSTLALQVVLLTVLPVGLAVAGVVLALLGIGVTWADAGNADSAKDTLVGSLITYLVMLVGLGLVFGVVAVLLVGRWAVTATTAGLAPGTSTLWFVAAVGYAALGVRIALWRLPFEQLTPRGRRAEVRRRLHYVGRVTLGIAIGSVGVLILGGIGVGLGAFDTLAGVAPPLAAALDLLAAPLVLGTFGTVGTVGILASLGALLLRMATRRFDTTTVQWVAAAAAGVVLTFLLSTTVAFFVLAPFNPVGGVVVSVLILVVYTVVPPLLVGGTLLVTIGMEVGVIPDRAGGPAFAATGMVLAAIGFGGVSPLVAFACVVAAAVAWDASWYGLGLTAELGLIPETRRLELLHAVVVLGIGGVALVALAGLDLLGSVALAGVGNSVGLYVAGVGVLLLLLPLRG